MKMKKVLTILCAISLVMGITGYSFAAPFVLDFEGLNNYEQVGNFYNGGGGTDYGVTFSDNALAIIDSDAGGNGNFGGEPSPDTILFFLSGNETYMNYEAGFDTGFSFYYSAINNPGFINIYDNTNGTGNILANLSLPKTPYNGAPDPSGAFSPFLPIGVEFNGIAKSIGFGGVQNQIGFDNITFGDATPIVEPVPEPATILLFAAGMACLAGTRIRRNSK